MANYYRLFKWNWCGYVFLTPIERLDKKPERIDVLGTVDHPNYGDKSREAWVYLLLLTGNWRLFLREMCSGFEYYKGRSLLLNTQKRCGKLCRKIRSIKQSLQHKFRRAYERVYPPDVPF